MSKVIKRNGEVEEFQINKIHKSVQNAFDVAYMHCKYKKPPMYKIRKIVDKALKNIVMRCHDLYAMSTDEIREDIEKQLMLNDYYAAKEYILYKYERGDNDGSEDTSIYS